MYNGRGNRSNNNRGPPARERYGMSSQNRGNGLGNMTGPLMTEHLNLRALDLELALLKQKREIIEQQQEMLSQSQYGSQNNYYNQPDMYQSQASSTQSFSQYYDDPRPRDHGVKRRAIPVWDNASEPKRFSSDMPPSHSKRRDTFDPQNRGYGLTRRGNPKPPPLMAKQASKPRFNSSKVTKPKPNPALKTIRSAPIADRKNLISKASTLVEDVILYEDENKTSSKVLGRLELALGVILKEVKTLYGNREPPLNHPALKAIKKDIRARMRKVMLGKEVTTTADIVDQYRKVYSKKTNAHILKSGIDAMKAPVSTLNKLAIQILDKGRPNLYYKNNFTALLSTKLDEMFDNLRKLYKPDHRDILTIMNDILAQQDMQLMLKDIQQATKDLDDSKVANESKTDEESKSKTDEEENITDKDENITDKEENKTDNEENKTDKEENITDKEENKTDETENITDKEENKTDKEENETDKEVNKTDKDENQTDQGSKVEEENKTADNDVSIIDTTPEEPVIDLDQTTDEAENNLNESGGKIDAMENSGDHKENESKECDVKELKSPKDFLEDKTTAFKFRYYNKLIDDLLNSKLPQVIRKYKKVIMDQILTANEDYKNTLAYILVETKKRELRRENAMVRVIAQRNEAKKSALHFVKIFGVPNLPKRPIMQSFLDKFNPSTIKKHRTFNSLLFVGFANKEDYDNILAANKTVLGSCTLDIRPSENKGREEKKEEEKETENIKIDSDMDTQIDDLLQSIRNEEESVEKNGEGNENEKKEDQAKPTEVVEVTDESEIAESNNDTTNIEAIIIFDDDTETGDNVEAKNNGANDSVEIKDDDENAAEEIENPKVEPAAESVEKPAVEATKEDDKATSKRQSTRIATSTPAITTRRASRLNPN